MNAKVAAVMGRQRGLVRRRQALECGMTPEEIDRTVATGTWVVVRRGVYATGHAWAELDHDGRRLREAWGASLNMRQPHVLSHESAGLAHRLQLLRPRPWRAHVTRFGVQGCRTRHGVCHHLAPFEPWQIVEIDGVPTFDLARTAVDIARTHPGAVGLRHGLVACDSAMRVGATKAQFEDALTSMRSWPGVRTARRAVDLAIADTDSLAESLARLMLTELALGEVVAQFGLRDSRRTAWVDLRVGRQLIEVDGRGKYVPIGEGGLAGGDPGEVLWEEKLRQDWLHGFRLAVTRVTWDELMPRQWQQTQARLAREIIDTDRRWGSDVEDLAPYIIREPRRSIFRPAG